MALRAFDSRGLTALLTVGGFWLQGCELLHTVDTRGLRALHTVGESWLDGCRSLAAFDKDSLTSLTSIGQRWLKGCDTLRATGHVHRKAGAKAPSEEDVVVPPQATVARGRSRRLTRRASTVG